MLGSVLYSSCTLAGIFYSEALSYESAVCNFSKTTEDKKERKELSPPMGRPGPRRYWIKTFSRPDRSWTKAASASSSAASASPPRRPELTLRGILRVPKGEYVAYMEIWKVTAIPIRKGDKFNDIEVVDISERKVVLQWMGEKIHMSIEHIKTVDSPTTVRGERAGRRGPTATAFS